jgi:hypothetical protein
MSTQLLAAIGIILVIILSIIVVGPYRTQRRTKQMRAAATRLGYEFDDEEPGLVKALGEFALFSRCDCYADNTSNVLRARADGVAVTIFDHACFVGHGANQRIRRESVLLLESERLNLPAFVLHPQGSEGWLESLAGEQTIVLGDPVGFSAAYVLQGPDAPKIRALFSGDQAAFFARRRGLCVEGMGRRLLYYRAEKCISPKALPSFVAEGLAVLNVLTGAEVHAAALPFAQEPSHGAVEPNMPVAMTAA